MFPMFPCVSGLRSVLVLVLVWMSVLGVGSRAEAQPQPQPSAWRPVDVAVGPDSQTRVLWTNPDGRIRVWTLNASGQVVAAYVHLYTNAMPRAIAVGPDNVTRMLMILDTGQMAIRRISVSGVDEGENRQILAGPFSDGPGLQWSAVDVAVGSDNKTRVLWNRTDGRISLWSVNTSLAVDAALDFGPFGGWTARALTVGADNKTRVLWNSTNGTICLWLVSVDLQVCETYKNYGPFSYGSMMWDGFDIACGSDNKSRVIWKLPNTLTSTWVTSAANDFESYVDNPPTNSSPLALGIAPSGQQRLLCSGPGARALLWTNSYTGAFQSAASYNQAPTFINTVSRPYSIVVNWSPVPNATGYNLYRYGSIDRYGQQYSPPEQLIAQLAAPTTTYTDDDVYVRQDGNIVNLAVYAYRVVAITQGVESDSTRWVGGYGNGATSAPSGSERSSAPPSIIKARSNPGNQDAQLRPGPFAHS